MDPIDVALKNDGVHGHNMEWAREEKVKMGFPETDSLRECIRKGKAAIGWETSGINREKETPQWKFPWVRVTWNHEWEDSAGSGEIAMRLERNDGTLSILGMRCDNGVNAETAYCQVAADEIGMKIEDVFYRPHVDPGFFTMTPDSSTNMSVNGFAVRHAARMLKEKILDAVTSPRAVTQRGSYPPLFPDMKPEESRYRGQRYLRKKRSLQQAESCRTGGTLGRRRAPRLYELYGTERTPFSEPLFTHSYHVQVGAYRGGVRPRFIRQAHFMEIEINPETGEILINKVVNVNDVGKAINPMACEGQMYGGTYMGVGRAMWEEVVHDPVTGVMLNGNLLDYKIATIEDCGPIDTILMESRLGFGPYG